MPLKGAVILQVIPELAAGGAERTTIEIAAALTRSGARALVASRGGRLEQELADAGGELVRMDEVAAKNPLALIAARDRLKRLIKSEAVDIVHARSRAPAWSALWAARQTRRRFVTTYHGIYNARSRAKRFYNSVMARGDVVIANSNFTAEHIRATHAFAADRITVIPRGVDVDVFSPAVISDARRNSVLTEWGGPYPSGERLILLPARLTAWKGHRVAIAGAERLLAAGVRNWRMIFAGDPQGREDYRADLEARAAQAGLADRIRITGHCRDMPAAMSLADIVLAPSTDPEAFGRVAAEAGAMGRIVVGSDLGGQKEVVENGVTGFLCAAGNPDALAATLAQCLEMSPDERSAVARRAIDRVGRLYTTASLQAATLAAYERLLGKPSP
jgi:glycosyltransferase involved in cell wall biosynthesis